MFIIDENDENNIKKGRAKKIILTLLVFLLLGIVFNIFTAFFPIPPFVLENTEDLKPVKYGLPFGAIELTPDSESIQQLE